MSSLVRDDDASIRAVEALARELAEEPLPPIDLAAIERAVFAKFDAERRDDGAADVGSHAPVRGAAAAGARVRGARGRAPWGVPITAAAAALAIAGSQARDVGAPQELVASGRAPSVAGRASDGPGVAAKGEGSVGSILESTEGPRAYERAGIATFTLAPRSRARLASDEVASGGTLGLTIALEQGAVRAKVQPRAQGEPFAVEVGRTRVAVHGTELIVAREGERVRVDVLHGTVAVGPAGHPGATQGWILVGPEAASFSLDGARDPRWLGAPRAPLEDAAPEVTEEPARPSVSAGEEVDRTGSRESSVERALSASSSGRRTEAGTTSASRAREGRPPPAGISAGGQDAAATASILAGLRACYERRTRAGGVSFTVQSVLTLTLLPTGGVRDGVFDPPLSPTLMECAQRSIEDARYSSAPAPRRIRVPITLSR